MTTPEATPATASPAILRKAIFDAVRSAARPGLFNDPGNVLALDNLLDAFGVPVAPPVIAKRALARPAAFFAHVRTITGTLGQAHVDTMNDLLRAAAHWPASWLAYGLATAWHEARMTPVAEYGKGAGKAYGRAQKYKDAPYGRGLVQLTWDENYERADKELGLQGALLANFDLALRPDIAAAILVRGMEEGWFTGKKLADYITSGSMDQYRGARKIINGTDKADLIAGYAASFQAALNKGGWA